MKIETVEATAPSAWASYLINGDASGLEDSEIADADAFVNMIQADYPGTYGPVSCEDVGFTAYCDARNWGIIHYAGDCQTYTFLRQVQE